MPAGGVSSEVSWGSGACTEPGCSFLWYLGQPRFSLPADSGPGSGASPTPLLGSSGRRPSNPLAGARLTSKEGKAQPAARRVFGCAVAAFPSGKNERPFSALQTQRSLSPAGNTLLFRRAFTRASFQLPGNPRARGAQPQGGCHPSLAAGLRTARNPPPNEKSPRSPRPRSGVWRFPTAAAEGNIPRPPGSRLGARPAAGGSAASESSVPRRRRSACALRPSLRPSGTASDPSPPAHRPARPPPRRAPLAGEREGRGGQSAAGPRASRLPDQAGDGARLAEMENALTARDRVGVQDFVLLENFTSEAAFIENLRRRFKENLIYTYIGSVLVSVNPYKDLEIYSKQHMNRYRGVSFYEVSPHLYAIADNAYRSLRTERKDQCILISGESGAGKTEATKKILQYYAVTCPASEQVETVKDRLLQSNPVLEAFGNAKTLRNDNSSRFGKYMDVQFDYKGAPIGGHILNYLLEKSRVVHQNHGERNFHIFYQLLEGGEEDLLRRLGLEKSPHQYQFLVKGQCAKVASINDKSDWKVVRRALSVINFNDSEVEDLLSIIASVLHLGNVQFTTDEHGSAQVTTENQIKYLARLLGLENLVLQEALTHKKIIAKGEQLISPLSLEQASYARDALAKAVYGRTFSWLVGKINKSLAYKETESLGWRKSSTVLGLLDIYGFEVFQHNSFEQFCINYCNEKLQQLFIELTLKSEQEEYEAEGIAWEPVQYFNNKIICDLVEEKFKGIISILDEECLRPGDATDMTFLEKLEETIKSHPHFLTHKLADAKTRKSLGREEFRLLHYAGEVTYSVAGFLDKNNDLLFRNLKEAMCDSENPIITQCFDRMELTDKKRPETAVTQFKNSLLKLMEILMSKEPSYVRCIKPNHAKQAGNFDEVLIRHQVKYLGLMENLRVRRAGFAYRRKYEVFLQRYKSLCPETWPTWNGRPQDGVAALLKHLGFKQEEYKLGRTKIFIRFPKTLFATEEALEVRKQSLATKIQAAWRGFYRRKKYLQMKHSAVTIQAWWRGTLGRRKAAKKKWAVEIIRRFIKGFIYRNCSRSPENEYFLDYIRYSFLMNLKRNLPKTVLDKSWPVPPPSLREASQLLRELCMQNLVWSYCKRISPEWKVQLEQKVVASEIFKGKKDNYPQSVPRLFLNTRLGNEEINAKILQVLGNEALKYAVPVIKYDRKGYKARARQLLLTQNAAVLVEESKVKQQIDYSNLTGISVSSLSDNLFVLHVLRQDNKQKGDVVLQSDFVIETLTKIAISANKVNNVNINQGSIKFTVGQGKEGIIDFTSGSELLIAKAKNGHLAVVAPRLNSR